MQVLVVGAGVVGLAVARAAALAGHEVIVAEATRGIGNGVSSRNSEVIHGGMYYPTGSLRAYHCPRGRRMLYDFCASHGVPHRKCGKLIVATEEAEVAKMAAILAQGQTNGVEGFAMIDGAAARALEPALNCVAALHSPETGIIDSHSFMRALQGDLEDRGGVIAFDTRVERLSWSQAGWLVRIRRRRQRRTRRRRRDQLRRPRRPGACAATPRTYPAERVPRLVLARGNYFGYAGRPAFSRPDLSGAAHRRRARHPRHARPRRAHALRAGCRMDRGGELQRQPERGRQSFYGAIRRYWPALPDGKLQPDYAGIRPKLTGPGEPAADFLIDAPQQHGLPRLIHLFGIESPGLTSSLSLAEAVVAQLAD